MIITSILNGLAVKTQVPSFESAGLNILLNLEPKLFEYMKRVIPGLTERTNAEVRDLIKRGVVTQEQITSAFRLLQSSLPKPFRQSYTRSPQEGPVNVEFHEMITLEGRPFPMPLPLPAAELMAIFRPKGLAFSDEGRTLVFRSTYEHQRLEFVNELIVQLDLDLEVTHSVWSTFNEQDFRDAPLWIVYFPEIWVNEVDFSLTCEVCGSRRIVVNPAVRVEIVEAKDLAVVTETASSQSSARIFANRSKRN